tara:strand:+ start:4077 stop:4262 length:186 start_codon:yes stop_codon:yes gene_type:complete
MILTLISCLTIHSTSAVGIVDYIGQKNCTVEMETGALITITSSICQGVKEGDTIYFYVKKK